jgi:hypothetical protein
MKKIRHDRTLCHNTKSSKNHLLSESTGTAATIVQSIFPPLGNALHKQHEGHDRRRDHLEASGTIDARTRDVSDEYKRQEKRSWTTGNEPQ